MRSPDPLSQHVEPEPTRVVAVPTDPEDQT